MPHVVFALGRALRYIASWPDEPETFTATMRVIYDGAATLIDALDAAMSGEQLKLAAERYRGEVSRRMTPRSHTEGHARYLLRCLAKPQLSGW